MTCGSLVTDSITELFQLTAIIGEGGDLLQQFGGEGVSNLAKHSRHIQGSLKSKDTLCVT